MKDIVIRSKFTIAYRWCFDPSETHRERHRRRHATAMADVHIVSSWCEYHGVEFRLGTSRDPRIPYGWKWDFRVPNKFMQWRPFAGKLHMKVCLRSRVAEMIKVYDVYQLLVVLERWLTTDTISAE